MFYKDRKGVFVLVYKSLPNGLNVHFIFHL